MPMPADLEMQLLPPTHPRDGTPVLVLMHGRGAGAADLAGFRGWVPDRVALALPQAPHPGAPWGYGDGWAWYRYEGDDRPDVASFSDSLAALGRLISSLETDLGFQPGAIVLGGFSQGGTLALGYALSHPDAVPGVMNLSGFLPSHPDVVVTPETVGRTRFFWGHGARDPAIPLALARRGRESLRSAGADLEAHDYAMNHGIIPDELRDAMEWLERVLAASSRAARGD